VKRDEKKIMEEETGALFIGLGGGIEARERV